MPAPRVLLDGLAFPESPRWHAGRLWFANWGAQEIIAVDEGGRSEVMLRVPTTIPFSIDWTPAGHLLVVLGREGVIMGPDPDGELAMYADLRAISDRPWNEIVVAANGDAYVNGSGFDFLAGEAPAPGIVALVTPDGAARHVGDGGSFPNGMAITADGATLILAESTGNRLTAFDIGPDGGLSNRRTWAELGDGAPDGICIDAEGAVWYADVPNRCCVRVAEGGAVLDTVDVDRGCFACMLGGADGRTLFIAAAEWNGPASMASGARTGQVLAVEAPAPHAGWP